MAAVSAAGYGRRAAFSRTAVVSVGDEASGGIEAAGASSPKIIVRREGSEWVAAAPPISPEASCVGASASGGVASARAEGASFVALGA